MSSKVDHFDFGDSVDRVTFEQILEMDDEEDDTHEFSSGIVFGFLDQAVQTFEKMDKALKEKDLPELAALGHFLKGSSATLGYKTIRDECEKIQHYGHKKDESGTGVIEDSEKCLALISQCIARAKRDFVKVEAKMKEFFEQD